MKEIIKLSKTFLHNPKIAFLIIFVVFFISTIIIYFFKNNSLIVLCGLIILCLPYIIPFIIFGGISAKQKYLDPLWIKVVLFIIFSIYIALSVSWSSSTINDVFHVSASNFPITTALINIAYLPYNFFDAFINYTYLIFIILSPVILLICIQSKKWIKYIFYMLCVCIYIGVSQSSISIMINNKSFIIKTLAIKLDFDAKNNCFGFNEEKYKVIHMNTGKIIVFDSDKHINSTDQFKVHDCKNL